MGEPTLRRVEHKDLVCPQHPDACEGHECVCDTPRVPDITRLECMLYNHNTQTRARDMCVCMTRLECLI